jgi:hypothetical protein
MRSYPAKVLAGVPFAINVVGNFIKCEVATSLFTVTVDNDGKPAEFGVEDWWEPSGGFSRLVILSLVDQDIILKVGNGRFGSTRIGGDVSINGLVKVDPNGDIDPRYYGMAFSWATGGKCPFIGIRNGWGSGKNVYLVGIPAVEQTGQILMYQDGLSAEGGAGNLSDYAESILHKNDPDSADGVAKLFVGTHANRNRLGGQLIAGFNDRKTFSFSRGIRIKQGETLYMVGTENQVIYATVEIVEQDA